MKNWSVYRDCQITEVIKVGDLTVILPKYWSNRRHILYKDISKQQYSDWKPLPEGC